MGTPCCAAKTVLSEWNCTSKVNARAKDSRTGISDLQFLVIILATEASKARHKVAWRFYADYGLTREIPHQGAFTVLHISLLPAVVSFQKA